MKSHFGALTALLLSCAAGPAAKAQAIEALATTGTVRVNCLANLEAVLNIVANSLEITGLLIGIVLLVRAITKEQTIGSRWKTVVIAVIIIAVGLASPGAINWAVATARDANLFV